MGDWENSLLFIKITRRIGLWDRRGDWVSSINGIKDTFVQVYAA